MGGGAYHRPDVILCMSYNNFVPGNVFVIRGRVGQKTGAVAVASNRAGVPPRYLSDVCRALTCAP